MNALLEQALKLPISERRKLADDIYDSIDPIKEEFNLTSEQKQELDRRIEDARGNPDKLIPWERVRERLQKIA
jgi:putative addiction module component (TIGR02574 family)